MRGISTIPCTIYPGMFSDERAVVIKVGERVFSLFAPIDAILWDSDIQAHLKVQVVGIVEDSVVVDLPGDSFQAGTRIVVPMSFLVTEEERDETQKSSG